MIAPGRLELYVCDMNPDRNPEVAHLVETEVDVQVEVIAAPHPYLSGGQDCRDRAVIQLQEPLGDRDVVDACIGKVVRLQSQ